MYTLCVCTKKKKEEDEKAYDYREKTMTLSHFHRLISNNVKEE